MPKSEHINAGGGVVFRLTAGEPDVVLIFRRGFWDIPKGKLDPGESIEMCAAREVSEEIGVPIPVILSELCQTVHEYAEKKKKITKTTWWYAMVSRRSNFKPQGTEQIDQVKWVSLTEAKELVGFDNLRTVLNSFESWFNVTKAFHS